MIRMFAWLQPHLFKRPRFQTGDITWCYNTLDYQPSNTSKLLRDMEGKELLKDGNGWRCEGKFNERYDKKYGEHETTVKIRQQVKDLINSVPDISEQDFMKEAET